MSLFYTRKGDNGYSSVGKKKVPKTCIEIEALGELDELNSMIGVLKSQRISPALKSTLHEVQECLFIIQANVAEIMLKSGFKVPEFKAVKITKAEKLIDDIEKRLDPVKAFVISGSDYVSAQLDLLRARSRKVERTVLRIEKINELDKNIKIYLNRLSSLFFALARQQAKKAGKRERNPAYR